MKRAAITVLTAVTVGFAWPVTGLAHADDNDQAFLEDARSGGTNILPTMNHRTIAWANEACSAMRDGKPRQQVEAEQAKPWGVNEKTLVDAAIRHYCPDMGNG